MPKSVLPYKKDLKETARHLRKNMTDAEKILWSRLRRKQILNVQFYRQKPIGHYILDFIASKARLVIEVDGSQHKQRKHKEKDEQRDKYLSSKGIEVLRLNANEVVKEIDSVTQRIYEIVKKKLRE
jgi:very-short-patch-repair endonuclease